MPSHRKLVPVILSGGSGTRLWPLSRDARPKQFLGLVDPRVPLIEETIRRVLDTQTFHAPVMIGNADHRFLLAEQMHACGFSAPDILIEPVTRNTAAAIAVAALHLRARYGDALMLVLPTDHVIGDREAFLSGVSQAAQAAEKGYLVTFGITPHRAETGYGYIRLGAPIGKGKQAYAIDAFVEKPDAETAKRLLATGGYVWNSGMFVFPVGLLLKELAAWQPALLAHCERALAESVQDLDFLRLGEAAFRATDDISIDYALMEKTQSAAVVPLECGWSDTGAWDMLWNIAPKNADGNVTFGECYLEDSRDCYVRSESGAAVATLGVENLVVIATKDAVMVAAKDKAQSLKPLVAQMKEQRPELVRENARVFRPWGSYESLHAGERFQVKRLTVKPGQKLSLQMHHHRAEHWIVVSGAGRMTSDDVTRLVTENQSFYVPCGAVHSIENPGKIDLEIIEVQSGAYLGEDDIVRFQDRYGRAAVQLPKP